jgi:hypothetical protein
MKNSSRAKRDDATKLGEVAIDVGLMLEQISLVGLNASKLGPDRRTIKNIERTRRCRYSTYQKVDTALKKAFGSNSNLSAAGKSYRDIRNYPGPSLSVAQPATSTGDTTVVRRNAGPQGTADVVSHITRPGSDPATSRIAVREGTAADPNTHESTERVLYLPFDKCTVAQNDFEKKCLKELAATNTLRLRWFGMGMEYGAPFLPDALRKLVSSVTRCNITVSIAMLDPTWAYLEHLHPNWPEDVPKSYQKLVALADEYRVQRERKKKVSVTIGTYKYVPNWHGFAINDSRFYISTCSWEESVPGSDRMLLVGGENPYILVDAERSVVECWIARVFSGWFDYAFNWSSRNPSKSQGAAGKR